MKSRIEIWTDGGSRSNIPPFGLGYGSFRIGENGKIISINFNRNMSANAAEIWTMVQALNHENHSNIILYSDSRIALKWLKDSPNPICEISDKVSFEMRESIKFLRVAAKGKEIQAKWRPRAQIFKIFGH